MSNLNFKFCPVCGAELVTGKILLPFERGMSSIQYVEWYSDRKIESNKGNISRGLFKVVYDKRTAVKKVGGHVPSGYCENCDRIFAEFDIREKYNPIGEEAILTYDMDYYEESADSPYEDKITSYDTESYDEKYNIIDGYRIISDNTNLNKSED
ncbi:MAG: hypothetical protein K2J40_09940 [Ruminococcus sp.]|nr:hypothetical protein [Ruminococcus sp.]